MSSEWQVPKNEPTTSEQIAELATALAKAQGSMGGALKDSANPFFKSKYADLESVWTACRKALSENGLAVIQTTDHSEIGVRIITTLVHASGQWIRGVLPVLAKDQTPQGIGSAITYARRYALAAMVGVYQTDDDGEAAHGRAAAPQEAANGNGGAKAQEYANRLMKALDIGIDQAIYDIHMELNEAGEEFYREAWHKIPSGARRQIKQIIDRMKAEAA